MGAGEPRPQVELTWHEGLVERAERWRLLGGSGVTVWFTGLSGSGKSSAAVFVERELLRRRRPVLRLDGDNVRHGLNADLGFGAADRDENVRRVGEVSLLAADAGMVVLVSLVSPYRGLRQQVRERHAAGGVPFLEVFMDTPLQECERRDPKGLYSRARRGELTGLTGVDDPWEEPLDPELVLRPSDAPSPETAARRVLELLAGAAGVA
ncbi:MAG: adenylyl-sulfate kinase [Acidimicrobiales bacterium]